jgi:hypothetical protein
MKQVQTISVKELSEMATKMYDSFVKAVVDLEKKIMAVDAEMHVDEEQLLLENGSRKASLWGINLYPGKFGTDDFITYESMINIRPRQNNQSRNVESADIRAKIDNLVSEVVHE